MKKIKPSNLLFNLCIVGVLLAALFSAGRNFSDKLYQSLNLRSNEMTINAEREDTTLSVQAEPLSSSQQKELTRLTGAAGGSGISLFTVSDGSVLARAAAVTPLGSLLPGLNQDGYSLLRLGKNIDCAVASDSTALFATSGGMLYIFGKDLADSQYIHTQPNLIQGMADVSAMAMSEDHALILTAGGKVYSLGGNDEGQLGNSTRIPSTTPVSVSLTSPITAVSAGPSYSLALTANGEVYGWGSNNTSQLCQGATVMSTAPVRIAVPSRVRRIAALKDRSFLLTQEGEVYSSSGIPAGSPGSKSFTRVGLGDTIRDMSRVDDSTLALVTDSGGIILYDAATDSLSLNQAGISQELSGIYADSRNVYLFTKDRECLILDRPVPTETMDSVKKSNLLNAGH